MCVWLADSIERLSLVKDELSIHACICKATWRNRSFQHMKKTPAHAVDPPLSAKVALASTLVESAD